MTKRKMLRLRVCDGVSFEKKKLVTNEAFAIKCHFDSKRDGSKLS